MKLVYITGKDKKETGDFIFKLLNSGRVKRISKPVIGLSRIVLFFKDIIILEDGGFDPKELSKFFSYFVEVVVVVDSENVSREKEIVSLLDKKSSLLVNYKVKEKFSAKRMHYLSYGFNNKADFFVSDVIVNNKTNFKINYKGSSIPVWIEKNAKKKKILQVTSALGVGVLLGINFVSLTQRVKNHLYNN